MVTVQQAKSALEKAFSVGNWQVIAEYINDNAVAYHLQENLRAGKPILAPSEPIKSSLTGTAEVKPAYSGMGAGNTRPSHQPRRA
jgi:hypothetical protein